MKRGSEKTFDYDSVSKVYDQVRMGNPEMIFHLLEEFSPLPESLVLDVGCGTANNTLLFQKSTGARMVGLDLSRGMLAEAQSKADVISLVHAPANKMPFPSNTFDMIVMTEVLHHLPDAASAIHEMGRILGSGLMCIVTQSHQQIEDRMTSRFFPATVDIDKARYPNIPEIEYHMDSAGLERVWSKRYKFNPVMLGEEYLDTVSRKGYSMLHKISENDYQEGLKALQQALAEEENLDYAAGYTYVWARRD
ncbi:MAG: class I SAM-dependent methyltransferase [Candidatus Thorarchaeota archaeon]